MSLPSTNEFEYVRHHLRDLERARAPKVWRAPTRILAARNGPGWLEKAQAFAATLIPARKSSIPD